MKLHSQQLAQHLSKSLASLYLVSGDDPFLTQEAVETIRGAAYQREFSERIRIPAESGTDWGKNFYAHAQSFSLFSTKRILELDLTHIKLNVANTQFLQEYAASPPSDTLLLIRIHKLDSKTEQTAWYKAIDKAGVCVPVWPITIEQLPAWILQRAKKLNLIMTAAAADFLALQTEGNLLAAVQELEKLRLLQPDGKVDQHVVENAVADNAHFDIFMLVDSILTGNHKRSLRILENLAAEDVELTLILWALTRELRNMAEITKEIQRGVSLGSLFPKFRIFEKRQPSVRAFLKRHTQQSCWNLLASAANIDRIIKGADTGNAWDSLQQMILAT